MYGSVQSVIICQASPDTVSPCPTGTAPVITSAYLLDPVAQGQVDAALAPIDYSVSSAFSLLAFVSVIGLWSLSQLFSHTRRAIR